MASQFPVPFASARDFAPLAPLDGFTQEINRLFGNFFPAAGSFMGLPARAADLVALPRLDVQEDDSELRISAELPGVNAADVEVRMEGDMLVICGEKKAQQNTSANNYHVMERSFGRFKRAISLPFTPDAQAIEADFDLGVLTVHVPKPAQRETSRRIAVRQGPGGIDAASTKTYLNDEQRMPAGPDSEPQVGDEPAH